MKGEHLVSTSLNSGLRGATIFLFSRCVNRNRVPAHRVSRLYWPCKPCASVYVSVQCRARVILVPSSQNDITMEHENDTRVRLRRTKSETRAEEIQKAEQMVRKSQPDKP